MNTVKKTALVVAGAGLALGAAAGSAFAHDGANGNAVMSPGVGSGNNAQAPVHVPVNATGNSANVIGALNPAFDNISSNG
ncbi:chaplin [Streptomyces halobius]|uniref:Chaplin n=1 Tax=Streptomyces halobius TaxID=2879846 RepID=A0ABY4MFR6_9ACTN|nr:chaplin [Streptomyces halobius]UQA96217.1 chaplin [Streptomyces halobius]